MKQLDKILVSVNVGNLMDYPKHWRTEFTASNGVKVFFSSRTGKRHRDVVEHVFNAIKR